MQNIKLEIKNADGSTYWTEFFGSQAKADAWLNEEKTRPYWKQDFTYQLTDLTPPPPTQAEIDAITAAAVDEQGHKVFLKGLKKADLVDINTCAAAIMRIVKFLKADK